MSPVGGKCWIRASEAGNPEPFNKLGAQLRHDFRCFVFGHAAERKLPTLPVTHDATHAQAAGGRVIGLA